MDKIKLIAGLGNPGSEYVSTRHNLGFMLIEMFAGERALSWKAHGRAARIAKDHSSGLLLLEPQAFMNNSGEAVALLMRENNLTPGQLLVISDDFSLPLGTARLRRGGISGGHKGLSSIISHLGTQEFSRLRLGMGPLPEGADVSQFVLSPIPKAERSVVDEMLSFANGALTMLLEEGFEQAAAKLSAGKQ